MKTLIFLLSMLAIVAFSIALEKAPLTSDVAKENAINEDLPQGSYLLMEASQDVPLVSYGMSGPLIYTSTIVNPQLGNFEDVINIQIKKDAKNSIDKRVDLHYDPGSMDSTYSGVA